MRVYLTHLYRRATERARLLVNSISERDVALTLLGYVVGILSAILVVSFTASAAEPGVPPPRFETRSAPLSGGVLTLHKIQGLCKAPAALAEFRHPDPGLNVDGCWLTAQDPRTGQLKVVVMFLDAEMAVLPTEVFK